MVSTSKNYETSFNTSATNQSDSGNEENADDKVAVITSLLPVSCEHLLNTSLSSLSIHYGPGRCSLKRDDNTTLPDALRICDEFTEENQKTFALHNNRCTPPSTAPLPIKFHLSYKGQTINSVKSDTDLINCDTNDPCQIKRYHINNSGTYLTDPIELRSDNEETEVHTRANRRNKEEASSRVQSNKKTLSVESVENEIAISTSDYSTASRITIYLSSNGSNPSLCKRCYLNAQSIQTVGKNILSPISDKSQEVSSESHLAMLQRNVSNNSIQPTLQEKKSNLKLDIKNFKSLKPKLD